MLMEQETEENKPDQLHLGVIRVSMRMLKDLFQLPDSYQIVSATADSLTNELRILVSNPSLPVAEPYQFLPEVRPDYSRIETGPGEYATKLTDIKIETA